MKKYIQPKIKVIELDSKQAILQVCKINGVYLTLAEDCVYVFGGTVPIMCYNTPKGATTFLFDGKKEAQNIPS
ncbi:MAG: hypothetical protein PHQ52_01780 [Candidatus Omnitrophica bacterium]|nr:hypothetical protein [Candidatus Omnitrophota bacterium]